MNLIKKFFLVFISLILGLSSYTQTNEVSPPSRVYDADGPKAEALLKDLMEGIGTRNAEKIKSLFSLYAQANANDLAAQVQYLLSIVDGDIIHIEASPINSGESWRNGSVVAMAGDRWRFITDVRAYQIIFWIYTRNDGDPTKEGIHCIQIIPQEIDTFTSSSIWPDCDVESFENAPIGVISNETGVKCDINEDGVQAKEKIESLIRSIEAQNAAEVASAFSPYTQANTEHFDEDVSYLMSIFKGKVVNLDWSSLHDGAYYDSGAFPAVVTASGWVEITTDVNVYRLYCYDFLNTEYDSAKEGIYRLQLMPQELWTKEVPAWLWKEHEDEIATYPCGIIRNEPQ